MIVIGTKCRLEQTVTQELTAEAVGYTETSRGSVNGSHCGIL